MRVIHAIGTLNRGGAETFLVNLVKSSGRLGIEFLIVCYGADEFDLESDLLALGAQVVRIPSGTAIRELRFVIRQFNPDVVHAHTDLNAGVVMLAAALERVRVRAVHSHLASLKRAHPSAKRRLYEMTARVSVRLLSNLRFACGRDAGREMFGCRRFVVQPNGIDLDRFRYSLSARRRGRAELLGSSDESELAIGVVARLEKQKNLGFLLPVIRLVKDSRPDLKVFFVGRGSEEAVLRRITDQLELTEDVVFLGVRSDVHQLLSAFDVVVLPSLYEGFPVTAVEAQVNGIPFVMSDRVDSEARLNDNCVVLSIDRECAEQMWASAIVAVADGSIRRERMTDDKMSRYDASAIGASVYSQYCRVIETGQASGLVGRIRRRPDGRGKRIDGPTVK